MNNSQIARRMQSVRPSPTAVISDQVRALEAAGKPVINLGEGELDFDTPAHISYAGIEAIVHHQTKYTAVSGTAALKEAIAAKFARDNQLHYRPQEIIAGSGAKQLIFNAFLATLDAGQQVIIPAPYWVSYPDMVSLADGEPVIVPCDEQNGWKLTPEQLAAALTPSTRWLILNSPGNPTGAIYSEQELRALAAVLADYPQVLVMADDIYEPLRYDNIPFTTFAQAAPQMVSRTLTVNGVSKSHAMTGWRLGYAGGPQWLIAAMQILQSQSTSNPSSISQAAAAAALNHSANFFDGWLNVLDKRRQQVLGMIAATDGLSATAPQGAFYVFANCQALMGRMTPGGEILRNDSALANWLLEQTQVAVLHGSAFGMPGYLRIAYAVEDGLLTQACQRIAGACAQLR
ncbi:pyridoxal phosphate-dependent aminotransferase [Klebsiella variicola]|uniref:pyridoxal phosphate-dependent aminotransferase n=1 Tax=Klebsiella variicola TaxID=244366 RepID=UPI000627851D|nr:pyridoxal phosphate-dependent aminotransferase [Klebsiella variicola]MCE7483822.1 pyridoxal phosphate-dependent aminotransferase [Klebsiella variicola]HBQ3451015.1 pyridoxal phosphate-dependent aminotransferase [Klebsiella variicola subsp. variicola]